MVSHVAESVEEIKGNTPICYTKHSLPMLEAPKTVRIKFSKTGSLQYISHLDLQRLFARAAIRAGIPLWYTQGFNPHPKMVFALPLPVGVQSVCEFLDVKIDRVIENSEIKSLLNRVLTDELMILDVYEPAVKFAEIGSAEYSIRIKTPTACSGLAEKIAAFLTGGGVLMKKHTKSGEKEVDISSMIYDLSSEYDAESGSVKIKAVCSAGTESLNPEYIVSALKQYEILPKVSLLEEVYEIMRERVLSYDRTEFR